MGPVFNSIDLEGASEGPKEKDKLYQISSYIFIYRAYKYQQILLVPENWNQISALRPTFVSEFYMRLHQAMRKKAPTTSINLSLELIDFFLKIDPKQSIVNILHYNIPFVLLWNIKVRAVQELLFRLVNLAENYYNLSISNTIKLSRFYRSTDFFVDYVKLIVHNNSSVDFRKCAINYKPPSLYKICQMNQKFMLYLQSQANKLSHKILPVKEENPSNSIKNLEKDEDSPLLVEEKLGLESDIDGIKPFLGQEKFYSSKNLIHQPSILKREKRTKSVPRINLCGKVEHATTLELKENDSNTEAPSLIENKSEHFQSNEGRKSVRMYPSMLESSLKMVPPPASERGGSSRSVKRILEIQNSKRRDSNRAIPKLEKRGSFKGGDGSLVEPLSERLGGSRKFSSDGSRPGTSSMRPRNQLSFIPDDPSLSSISYIPAEEDGIKSRKPSFAQLPLVMEQDSKQSMPNIKETGNYSLLGANNSQNNTLSASQSIFNVYALPSKALGKAPTGPKFYSVKQTSSREEEWLGQQYQTERGTEEGEERAYLMAKCLQNFVQDFFERYEQTRLMKAVGIKDMTHIKLIKALEASEGVLFFSMLLKVRKTLIPLFF